MEPPALGPAARPGPGLGCLGPILGFVVLVALVAAVATIGLVVLAVVAVAAVVGLVVFAVDRLLLALSPKRRERRDDLLRSWGVGGGRVIDSTAIDTTATVEVRDPQPPPGRPAPPPTTATTPSEAGGRPASGRRPWPSRRPDGVGRRPDPQVRSSIRTGSTTPGQ